MRRLVVVLLLALSTTAVAQPALTPPAPLPELPDKDAGTATILAIGGTALGFVSLYAAGRTDSPGLGWTGVALLVVGPSAGHIYAGESGHATKTSLVRLGGMLTAFVGFIALVSVDKCSDGCGGNDDQGSAEAMLWVGGITYAAATLYDIIDASSAARRANAKQARAWQIAPTAMPASNGSPIPGLSVAGHF
jgi:hypothetical protein